MQAGDLFLVFRSAPGDATDRWILVHEFQDATHFATRTILRTEPPVIEPGSQFVVQTPECNPLAFAKRYLGNPETDRVRFIPADATDPGWVWDRSRLYATAAS